MKTAQRMTSSRVDTAWRSRLAGVLTALLGTFTVGACADDPDPAAPVTTRDQLVTAEAFRVAPADSTVALAMSIETPYDSQLAWVSVPVARGALVAASRGDTLSLEKLELTLHDIDLLDVAPHPSAGDDDDDWFTLRLEDISIRALAPVACAASWSEDGETASCDGRTVLSLEWALRLGHERYALDPVLLGPFDLGMFVDHVGDELQLATWGAVEGANWSAGPFTARATLVFDVQSTTPDAAAPPGAGLQWHQEVPRLDR